MLRYFYLEMKVQELSEDHPFGDGCCGAMIELFVPAESVNEAADKGTDYLFEQCMESGVIRDCYEPLDGEIKKIFADNGRVYIEPSNDEIIVANTQLSFE